MLVLGFFVAGGRTLERELTYLVTLAGALNMMLNSRAEAAGWNWAPTFHMLRVLQVFLCLALPIALPGEALHFMLLAAVFWFADIRHD